MDTHFRQVEPATRDGKGSTGRRTFVLIHGGCHGGWSWRRVRKMLQQRGHAVFTPSLTGLGDRHHLVSPLIDLGTHVQDIVELFQSEELSDVVLVGHSYGGLPISGAADQTPGRIRHLIFLDALPGRDGGALLDEMTGAVVEERLKNTFIINGATVSRPSSAEFYGVSDPVDVAWVNRRVTPHPTSTYTAPLILKHPVGNGRPCTFIRCVKPHLPSAAFFADRAKHLGMTMREIEAGHDAMITSPRELAALLMDIAG